MTVRALLAAFLGVGMILRREAAFGITTVATLQLSAMEGACQGL